MRILVLTFYFKPDLSAGSFRSTALVEALANIVPPDTKVDVITTMPNRYRSFTESAPPEESSGSVSVRRISLPAHRSDFVGQSRAFLRYARQAKALSNRYRYDLVFATSSRLMTATLGASIARRHRCPLYLDIRDLFADTLPELLPNAIAWPVSKAASAVESWTMRRAKRINLVSRGFEEYFRQRYPGAQLSWYPNGIDDVFLQESATTRPQNRDIDPQTLVYAGNIGEGQCLHEIVPALAKELSDRCRIVIIGDGGRRAELAKEVARLGVSNVEMRLPVARNELIEAYRSADVLFLHLGAYRAFEKVLPSKLFEYAAMGRPILAGVGGYAAQFIETEVRNAAVFPPCDVAAAVKALDSLSLVPTVRTEFTSKFSRSELSRAMASDILDLGQEGE